MPGGFVIVSSDGSQPNTGVIWSTAPYQAMRIGTLLKEFCGHTMRRP